MDNEKENMDRTFMKTSLATGAGLVLAGSMGPLAWGSSASGTGLANLSLYQLSKMIRTKELSSKKLVELYLDRIKKFSKPDGINAYITVAGDAAMREAERLDNLAKQNKFIGPLHGLPIAVKDNLDTKNIRTTGGSKILESWTPPQDANVIKKLKEAGAIIIGKTNMHEFAFGITTNNLHYGPTRNPYDLSR
ncbi:MAG: amidase, partial [Proteobacteria bacterium]|nr:amidase [Pseudomonadota bacterium]